MVGGLAKSGNARKRKKKDAKRGISFKPIRKSNNKHQKSQESPFSNSPRRRVLSTKKKSLGRGYIGNSRSVNAQDAVDRGLFVLSSIRAPFLKARGFRYSVSFFKWLCKRGYIAPSELHHATPQCKLTRYYSARAVTYANTCLNLPILYRIYLGLETTESAKENLNVIRANIPIARSDLGLGFGEPIIKSAIIYERQVWFDENRSFDLQWFRISEDDIPPNNPQNWYNPREQAILSTLITRIRRKPQLE